MVRLTALLVIFGIAWISQAAPETALVELRENGLRAYEVERPAGLRMAGASGAQWARAWRNGKESSPVLMGSRVLLQVDPGNDAKELADGTGLKAARQINETTWIFQASDAWTAAHAAALLAAKPGVLQAHPVMRRPGQIHGAFPPRPNDPYFSRQWYLENWSGGRTRAGVDLNVRAAWASTLGEGITIAVVDEGVEISHPDLLSRTQGTPHFNWEIMEPRGEPLAAAQIHGTAVAGIIAAEQNNRRGITGIAPRSSLASWVVFATNFVYWPNGFLVDDEQLMDMFQYASNVVSVQNHSWGNPGAEQLGPSALVQIGISNAITFGRQGKGVIMIRSGGNQRAERKNVNDDGYPSDPRAIAVGAVKSDGRFASYSNPGACLLVSAPSGDLGFPNIMTTDRVGSLGYNQSWSSDEASDYIQDAVHFSGTSAAAPQIAALAGLILSVNSSLTYRDVQQILLLSATQTDREDPLIETNKAGLPFSPNTGYGAPDSALAVHLAKQWVLRPALQQITSESSERTPIPDDGLRVMVSGPDIPEELLSIPCKPPLDGPQVERDTAKVEMVWAGLATNRLGSDFSGKAALIQRGVNTFDQKIRFAADAGSVFAVVYNNRDGTDIFNMAGVDYCTIPSVLISQNSGQTLANYLSSTSEARVKIALNSAVKTFQIDQSFLCEHVGVRIKTDHPRRADLRITLVSPSGTRTALQHAFHEDTSPGPLDWTYYSTQFFYENAQGEWQLVVSDLSPEFVGNIEFASLIVNGVPLQDADADGLADDWERAQFGALTQTATDDPDKDGFNNMEEWISGTQPVAPLTPFEMDIALFSSDWVRLSWMSGPGRLYEIWGSMTLLQPPQKIGIVMGKLNETEWLVNSTNQFQHFQVREANP